MPQIALTQHFGLHVTPMDLATGRLAASYGPHPRYRYGVQGLGTQTCQGCGNFAPATSSLGPMGPAEFFGGRTGSTSDPNVIIVNPNNTPIPDYYYAAAQAAQAGGVSWAMLTSGSGDVVYVNPDGTIARTWNPLLMWQDGCPYQQGCANPALRDTHFVSPGATAWGQQLVRIGFAQSTAQYNAQVAAAQAYAAQAAATIASQQTPASTPSPAATPSGAAAPVVQLTNLTRPGMAGFIVGDQFRLQITTVPNAVVTATSTQNGSIIGTQVNMGAANQNGIFTIQGTMSTAELGQWQEIWYANGTQATPVLTFTVGQGTTGTPTSSTPAGTTIATTTGTITTPVAGQLPSQTVPAATTTSLFGGIDPKYLLYGGAGLLVLILLTGRR